jgi:hypothetical protein
MRKRSLLLGVLCISLIVAFGGETFAAGVCVYRNPITGKCKIWSSSVECGITANGLGNVTKDPKFLGCTVMALPDTSAATTYASTPIQGLVYCGNPGKENHPAPGIQPCAFYGDFSDFTPVRKGDLDRNGVAYVTTIASLDTTQLSDLNACCPNPQWVAIDFVPTECYVEFDLLDAYDVLLDTATYHCVLPDPETLGWDKKAQKPERREYDCTEVLP